MFLGTAVDVNTPPNHFKTGVLKIDRAFKGDLGNTIELFYDGMCAAPDLEIGMQYLIYTTRSPDGKVPVGGCTRSRHVEHAADDLEFLKLYAAGKTATHIDGTVYAGSAPSDALLNDAQVTIVSRGKSFRATSDSIGQFSFPNAPPGTYAFQVDRIGYRNSWAPGNVVLGAGSCAHVDLVMNVDRRVEGVVRDRDGVPQPDVGVELVSADPKVKRGERRSFSSVSGTAGKYSIDVFEPGEYYLGINIESTPTKEQPYPATYYPNAQDVTAATRIFVNEAPSVQDFEIKVPPKLPLTKLHGRIRTQDGKPPRIEDHPSVRVMGPLGFQEVESVETEVDAEGNFEIELCEGIEYSAFAFASRLPVGDRSARVPFTPTKQNNQVLLVLLPNAEP